MRAGADFAKIFEADAFAGPVSEAEADAVAWLRWTAAEKEGVREVDPEATPCR
jgi:hypothetical protein